MSKFKYPAFDKNKTFFTSDLHFKHSNIIKFTRRPFYDVNEMENVLVSNWNNKVPSDGHTFILGDFAFTGNIDYIKDVLSALNGYKHLILGNHDYQNHFTREAVIELFDSVHDMFEIRIEDDEMDEYQRIVMCHYPLLTWNGKMRGSWQLFGHIHSRPLSSASEQALTFDKFQYDVGVDNNNFTPVSYEEIKTIFTHRALNMKD